MQLGSGIAIWLWLRPAAVALIRPLAWDPPYVKNVVLKSKKKKKKKKLCLFRFSAGCRNKPSNSIIFFVVAINIIACKVCSGKFCME